MNDDPATGEHRSSVVLTLPSHEIDPRVTLAPAEFNRRDGASLRAAPGHHDPGQHPPRLPPRGGVPASPDRATLRLRRRRGRRACTWSPRTASTSACSASTTWPAPFAAAHACGRDIAAPAGLERYEQTQRRATRPLYLATQLMTRIYTRDTPPARALRTLALHVGERFTPFEAPDRRIADRRALISGHSPQNADGPITACPRAALAIMSPRQSASTQWDNAPRGRPS